MGVLQTIIGIILIIGIIRVVVVRPRSIAEFIFKVFLLDLFIEGITNLDWDNDDNDEWD